MIIGKLFGKKKSSTIKPVVCTNITEALAELDRVGYCVFPLLDDYTMKLFLEESLSFINEVTQQNPLTTFLSIGRHKDAAVRMKSKEMLVKYLKPQLDILLDRNIFEIIYGTHLLKANSKEGVLNPHQDSSHVDELVYSSFHLWIPVTPPSPEFGTLQLIPNSHRLLVPYRSLNIPWALESHEMNLWKYMKKIEIEPGQVIIFNSKLIHGSGENKTQNLRIAANLLIKPASADFIHCYSDAASEFKKIELYNVTPEFYYNENIMERPANYHLIKTVDNTNKYYTLNELEEVFNSTD